MIVKWDGDVTTHINKTCIVRIYTGETQAVANWRAGLSARGEMADWDEAEAWVYTLAGEGKDITENQPEVERRTVGGRELAVVFGVLSNEISPRGRVVGEYRFVLCMESEVLLVLAKVFGLKRRLERGA